MEDLCKHRRNEREMLRSHVKDSRSLQDGPKNAIGHAPQLLANIRKASLVLSLVSH